MSPTHSPCSFCLEPKPLSTDPKMIQGNRICNDCIKQDLVPRFHAALEKEAKYPPGTNDVSLPIADFVEFLTPEFVSRYLCREKEYLTLPADRIYCRNAIFERVIGTMTAERKVLTPAQVSGATWTGKEVLSCDAMAARRSETSDPCVTCPFCNGLTCRDCEQPLFLGVDHSCVPINRLGHLDDLVKGRDYQLCPNTLCGHPHQLSDGCNHIICNSTACHTNYCYICGVEAKADSGHWDMGRGCPRYNQPVPGQAHDNDIEDSLTDWNTLLRNTPPSTDSILTGPAPIEGLPNPGQGWFHVSPEQRLAARQFVNAVAEEFEEFSHDLLLAARMAATLRSLHVHFATLVEDLFDMRTRIDNLVHRSLRESEDFHPNADDVADSLERLLQPFRNHSLLIAWRVEALNSNPMALAQMSIHLPLLERGVDFVVERLPSFQREMVYMLRSFRAQAEE